MKYWTSKSTGQEAVVNPRKGFVTIKKAIKNRKLKATAATTAPDLVNYIGSFKETR
jgi:hypothetical protein